VGPDATLVLYDGDCGICTCFAEWLAARGVAVAPIGSPDGERWLRDLSSSARNASFHAIDSWGRRTSGGEAVAPLLGALGARRAAKLAGGMPRATEAIYRLVARNRGLLSRLTGAAACGPSEPLRRASRGRAG
jgi:predicted DCC family thiol-disulfide oxidoreductase YuxK